MWKYSRHTICDSEIRRGKKERRKKGEETTGQKYNGLPIPYGGHNETL